MYTAANSINPEKSKWDKAQVLGLAQLYKRKYLRLSFKNPNPVQNMSKRFSTIKQTDVETVFPARRLRHPQKSIFRTSHASQ